MIVNTIRTYDEERLFLRSMLDSLWYNRDTKDYLSVLREVRKRIDCVRCDWSDDGNIIYGALVCRYGDYGVSPRAGWFDDHELVEQFVILLTEEINETIEIIEEEKG